MNTNRRRTYKMTRYGEPHQLIYTTTSPNQSVQIISRSEYIGYCKIIETEDEIEIPSDGWGIEYIFPTPGDHAVEIAFKLNLVSLNGFFMNCPNLTSIPSNLFNDCSQVTDFSNCFYLTSGLTSIPSNLFNDCSQVTNFSSCFYYCIGLTSIPDGLFDNCIQVTNFNHCFYDCLNLTSIPNNLFSKCTKVTKFGYCFYNCSSLENYIPIDSDGTPIYNRSYPGKNGYEIVTAHTKCFYNCTRLSDYNSIPTNWKS